MDIRPVTESRIRADRTMAMKKKINQVRKTLGLDLKRDIFSKSEKR